MPPEISAFLTAHPGTRRRDAVMFDLCGTPVGKRVQVRDAAKVRSSDVARRIPAGGRPSRRTGHRIAGAAAAPCLAMAAVAAGVHHGLANSLRPTLPSTGNAGEMADPDLPLRLWTALDRLAAGTSLPACLGQGYPAAGAAIKRSERAAFTRGMRAGEYDWYL